MSSREQILGRLRQAKTPFSSAQPPATYHHMVPLTDVSPPALLARFVVEAEKVGCVLHQAASQSAGQAILQELLAGETRVSAWELEHIPLVGLREMVESVGVENAGIDPKVNIGITGVDAALATTGSIVIASGNGRDRTASLLPPIHIAILSASQILPDLESWWATQRGAGLAQMRQHSNIVVITGPSRTADIAMKLVMGMHGPRELHLILLL